MSVFYGTKKDSEIRPQQPQPYTNTNVPFGFYSNANAPSSPARASPSSSLHLPADPPT